MEYLRKENSTLHDIAHSAKLLALKYAYPLFSSLFAPVLSPSLPSSLPLSLPSLPPPLSPFNNLHTLFCFTDNCFMNVV